jgi:hypothetical protein
MLRTALALCALVAALPSFAQRSPALPPVAIPPGRAQPDPAAPPSSPVTSEAGTARSHPPGKPLPRGAVLEEISGVLEGVDGHAHRITVGTAGGKVTLTVDRNTMVYTSAGLGTVADLVPGSQLRAGRNADALAYWVQVRRPAAAEPQSTPGQGTGPGGGSGPPAEGDRGAGTGGASVPGSVGPGSVAPGPASPAGGAQAR